MVPDTAAASVTRPHISSRPEKAILCLVCSDKSFGNNFGAITCESCKAFFRRTANERDKLACPFNDNCEITIATRKHCRRCRLEKCFAVGMIKEWIQSEEQLKIRRAILKERKLRRGMGFIGLPNKKLRSSPSRSASESGIGGSEDGTGTSSINSDNNYNITNASLLGINARRDKSSSWNTLTGIGPKFIKQVDNPVSRHHHVSNSKQYYGNQQSVAQFFNKITDQNFFANLVRSNIFYPTPQRSSTCQNSDEPNQRSSVITFTGKSSTSSSPALSISSSPDQGTHDTYDSDNNRVRHHESDPEVDIYPGNFDPDCQPIYQSLVKKKLPISASSCHPHSPPLSLSLTPSPQSSMTTSKVSTTKPTQSIPSSSSCSLSFSTEASTISRSHHFTKVSNIESNNNILLSKKINCGANFSQSVDQEGFIKPSPSSSTLSSSSHLEDPSKSLSLNVFHHIIDSYFTRINMKNERLNTGFALNSMEETRLVELTLAYGVFNEPLSYSFTSNEELLVNCYNASVCQLITMTKKLSTYCELPIADQIILLRGTFADILAMRGAFLFDVANSSWPIKGTDRLVKINQLFDINESFYNSYLKFILDLSPTWRDNIFINQLIIAIMLFNCNLSGLKSSEAIRLEYCAYIYLLQRYMESSFNLKDTAKETLCTILCKINQLQTINGNTVRINQSNDPLKLGTLDSLFLPD